MSVKPVKTIAERVAELVAAAPPITTEQREAVVRIMGPALCGHPKSKIIKGGEVTEDCVACTAPPLDPDTAAKIRALLNLGRRALPKPTTS